MCGIFGIIPKSKKGLPPRKLKKYTNDLFLLSESRGKEAAGLALLKEKEIAIYKHPLPASKLIHLPNYPKLFESSIYATIGHSRLVTNGHQSKNINNQPVVSSSGIMIHNGIIVNDTLLAKSLQSKPRSSSDTEVAALQVDKYVKKGYAKRDAVKKLFKNIEGSASIAYLSRDSYELILATNTGSVFLGVNKNIILFASEKYILQKFAKSNALKLTIEQIKAGSGVVIDTSTLNRYIFSFREKDEVKPKQNGKLNLKVVDLSSIDATQEASFISPYNNSLSLLKKHVPPYKKIASIRRCTKCILPETMPFISFDNKGVCNYCQNHKKINPEGKKSLEKFIARFRKKGKPDCIVALSGGRDSSYGLHYVKNVLGLNPIAYTYDWGMITDIARRNQARLVGKLGVEHLLVSADIKRKRENIKANVEAWTQKPDLGMVPLFAAGDKQAEYYIEELKNKTGIELVIYCRGNELEDERFKFGHLGIFDGTPKAVIHNLSFFGKIKMAIYYGVQYLTNTKYINRSLFDTIFAYSTTYLMRHNFLYLWHYIPWNEEEIVKTLKKEYNWEVAKDTTATWRIDDGTPSFYNYIYLVVQGFTEHDALRSNQIREGVITREKALNLVQEENKPRYEAMKWYFDIVGLDGDSILKVVDSIPKTYEKK